MYDCAMLPSAGWLAHYHFSKKGPACQNLHQSLMIRPILWWLTWANGRMLQKEKCLKKTNVWPFAAFLIWSCYVWFLVCVCLFLFESFFVFCLEHSCVCSIRPFAACFPVSATVQYEPLQKKYKYNITSPSH